MANEKRRVVSKRSATTVKFEKIGDGIRDALYLKWEDTEGDYGPCRVHIFQTKDGLRRIYAKQASQISEDLMGLEGREVDIILEGLKKSQKSGYQPTKVYGIFESDSNLDAATVKAMAADVPADDEPVELDDDETPMDEVVTPRGVINQNAVQSMLGGIAKRSRS